MSKPNKFYHPFSLRRHSAYSAFQGGSCLWVCGKRKCVTAQGSLAAFLVSKFKPITVDKKALTFYS